MLSPASSSGASFPPAAATVAAASKPQRVLSCILCAQRKVKCDRKSPCSNCTKVGAQCISAAAVPRQRRRRFPERELLERLRHYEHLLSENNIPFEPLHASQSSRYSKTDAKGNEHAGLDGDKETAQNTSTAELSHPPLTSTESTQAKSFWSAMMRKLQFTYEGDSPPDDDDSDEAEFPDHTLELQHVVRVWDQFFNGRFRSEHLLFCARTSGVELSALHPPQAQIFKLWQLYLENVDPLLKLTHTPTLQPRIIDAASDVTKIEPNLEALMFSIYCMAVASLEEDQCQAMFGTPRTDILRGYQLGAREALLNCAFVRSSNRECLTALHLYLFTLKPEVDPRSLSSMLGIAIRVAQRMGIDTETINAGHSVLEAELRRRLWWSLVLFDSRIAETTDLKLTTLIPTWDCHPPHNINDFSFRKEMETPPAESGNITEALFAVVRSKLGDFIRRNPSHLEFVNPVMKKIVDKSPSGSLSELDQIAAFESFLESEYLSQCDVQNPLHFMTIWWTRVFFAKTRFAHYLAKVSPGPGNETERQRDASLTHARTILECDTMLMSSPLIKAFRWMLYLYFPFPAYIHLVHDLKRRPLSDHADLFWKVMSDNCTARFHGSPGKGNPVEANARNPFFVLFSELVLQAWEARKAASDVDPEPPLLVTYVTQRLARMSEKHTEVSGVTADSYDDFPLVSGPTQPGDIGSVYSLSETFPIGPAQPPANFIGMQWPWLAPSWNTMSDQTWQE